MANNTPITARVNKGLFGKKVLALQNRYLM